MGCDERVILFAVSCILTVRFEIVTDLPAGSSFCFREEDWADG